MIQKLKEIVVNVLELPMDVADTITQDTDLQDLGLDSMTCVEIVVNLEEEFGITVDEEDLLVENMSTLSLLAGLVEKYQQ